MALDNNKTYDNTPNTGNIFDQQTSFQSDLFDSVSAHGGGEMGVGSFKQRSIDQTLVEYKPYDTAINTFVMLQGQSETVDSVVHEWGEDDLIMDYSSVGNATPTNADNVINNTTGVTAYVPATSAKFELASNGGLVFRSNDRIRYTNDSGGWTIALVTAVSTDELTLTAFDGENLPEASGDEAEIEVIDQAFGSDLNYDEKPRGTNPSMKYTHLQKLAGFGSFTERSMNEANAFDQPMRAQDQAMTQMNFSLEKNTLYGKKGKVQVNGDWVYSSGGLWDITKETSYQTDYLTDTGGNFDASKFKSTMYELIEKNYGAESGAPPVRQAFIDGRMSSFIDQAFEDKQRFYTHEFVGGMRVNRFDVNDGAMDFVRAPIFEMAHPVPNGSLRTGSSPRGVLLCLPVAETVTRLTYAGEGLRDDIYRKNGGDEELNYRIRYTTGIKQKLPQYGFAFEEVANPN